MIAISTAREALRKVGISSIKRKPEKTGPPSTQQSRIRAAAPRYMTDAQALALKIAGEQGWIARSIVANARDKRCVVSVQKDEDVAWIVSDGSIKSEDDIVKGAGIV
jgi:hypothetical protein